MRIIYIFAIKFVYYTESLYEFELRFRLLLPSLYVESYPQKIVFVARNRCHATGVM